MTLKPPPPQDFILVGATGDLAQRKLLPALYNLFLDGCLPIDGKVIGYSRTDMDDREFRELTAAAIREHSRRPFDSNQWATFSERLEFVPADPGGMAEVARRCIRSERLVYLAVPPSVVVSIVQDLAAQGLADGTRVVVEKPFGHDLDSAIHMDGVLHEILGESQIFRIDHYLGKETVQNILVFRFGSSMFERIWNRDAIEHVQITVAESIGVENRGPFYEEVGALRDIVQNHVLQVLALLTMEPPTSFDAEPIRDERAKLLRSIRPVDPAEMIRGQYRAGEIDGVGVPGYREEPGVAPNSETETFVACRLHIDNWRWDGVPFYLRTGKRLPRRVTEVQVVFRGAPLHFFDTSDMGPVPVSHLTLRIQPEAGISYTFPAKTPGPELRVEPVRMSFSYSDSFMTEPQEAYERLLYDAMVGDHTLFLREDGVEQAWRVVQPVLDETPPICFYDAGAWGPEDADALLAPRAWHLH